MCKTICYFVLSLLVVTQLNAQQNFRFNHFTVKEGLSQNSVNCIFQDRKGFIWFGTQDGLNKYDGYKFIHYRNELHNPNSLSDNFILSIKQDVEGRIWCTTRDGINCLDPNTGQVNRYYQDTLLPNNQAHCLFVNKDTVEVYFSNAVYFIPIEKVMNANKIQLRDNKQIKSTKNKHHVFTKRRTKEGLLIQLGIDALIVDDLVVKLDTTQGAQWDMTDALYCDNNGIIWFGNRKGLFQYNSNLTELKNILSGTHVTSIVEDDLGRVWVGSSNGLHLYRQGKYLFHLTEEAANSSSLSNSYIHVVFKDKSGLIWAGCPNTGVNVYDYRKEQFKFLNRSHGLGGKIVWSIFKNKEGDYLFGTNEGVYKAVLKTKNTFTDFAFAYQAIDTIYKILERHLVMSNCGVSSINETDEYLYIGTSGKGLYRIEKESMKIQLIPLNNNADNETIATLLKSGDDIWVGSFHGFYKLNHQGDVMNSYFPEPTNPYSVSTRYFLSLFQSRDSTIFLGSNTGYSTFDTKEQKFKNYRYQKEGKGVNFQFVSGFAENQNKGVWVATFGGGLNYVDKSEKFSYFTEKQGLANNVISAIVTDEQERLWMSTNKGISCFDPRAKRFYNFTTHEGVIFNEFALNSFYKNEEGEVFLGTADGLVIFKPEQIDVKPDNVRIPNIVGLKVNYEDVSLSLIAENKLDLYYSDKTISLEVSAMNYRNPKMIKYRYRLDGFNDDWIETNASHRIIHYSNLPSGQYILKIETANEMGSWVNQVKELIIIVHPPFWLTWWFILLEILTGITLIVIVVRYFAQRKLKKQLRQAEIQKKVHEERLRISRDLHDNIGSQLTFIVSSVDNLKYLFKSPDKKVKDKLNDVGNFTRTTITQLRDTIWALNKDEITFEDLKSRLYNYMESAQLAAEQTTFNFESSINASFTLNAVQAVNIYRIVQEAINNTMKYAAATNLLLSIVEEKEDIIINIKDDGIGFKMEGVMLGNGLENMKNRALTINASFNIQSTSEEGTTINLSIPKGEMKTNKPNAV